MASLTKNVSASISMELFNQFEKLCKHYRKPASQAITELIAAWANRPDLAGSHKSTSPLITRHILKADVAVEQIRSGLPKGWKNLIEAVNDLIFTNQMSTSKRYIDQAYRAAVAEYGEDGRITGDIVMLRNLLNERTASLSWEASSTWCHGHPTSAGYFLVISDSGEVRLSDISDESHPDIRNDSISCHLRISPPPEGKLRKKLRTEIQPEPDAQQEPFPTQDFRLAMVRQANQ